MSRLVEEGVIENRLLAWDFIIKSWEERNSLSISSDEIRIDLFNNQNKRERYSYKIPFFSDDPLDFNDDFLKLFFLEEFLHILYCFSSNYFLKFASIDMVTIFDDLKIDFYFDFKDHPDLHHKQIYFDEFVEKIFDWKDFSFLTQIPLKFLVNFDDMRKEFLRVIEILERDPEYQEVIRKIKSHKDQIIPEKKSLQTKLKKRLNLKTN